MRLIHFVLAATVMGGVGVAQTAEARKGRLESSRPQSAEEAIAQAEKALDLGSIGDALAVGERLQKTRGLTKEQQQRADLILARCGLVTGKYDTSVKIFERLRKASPDDNRLAEWHARALDGAGKTDAALALFSELASKDALAEGDSYWALAQLERAKGQEGAALKHAQTALEKPIVLQSDELDQAIHKFINELTPKKK
ncbi:MAG TPA: tetratricopeptide repeat protein [Polyangia bacterium]|nr:tetratricopeptide repeat protein [Polyangia bacterium]